MENTTISTEIVTLVETLVSKSKSYSAILAVLVGMDLVKNAKDGERVLAELGVSKGEARAKGLLDRLYDYLEDGPKTQVEFWNWVNLNGTANTVRWFLTHDKVRELTNRLHVNLSGLEFEDDLVPNVAEKIKDFLAANSK